MALTPSKQLNDVRAGVLRRPGLVSAPLREALVEAYDGWLQARLVDAPPGVTLVAVGGLGRREPAPYSDLDLVLVHDGNTEGVSEIADSIWYPIWDSGIGLDHSVRTVDQALDVARGDLKALLGLLDVRYIAGNSELAADLRTRVIDLWRSTATKRVVELRELSVARWEHSGEGAFLLEPDLKESRGGLRDVQSLYALARAQLIDLLPAVREANGTLLDVRGALHQHTGVAEDIFRAQEHDPVAAALGLFDGDGEPDRDSVLRSVNFAARTVSHALDRAWRRVEAETASRPLRQRIFGGGGAVTGPRREGLARDVVSQDGEVVLARDANPRVDSGLVMRVARAAAENELPIAAFTLDRLMAEAPPVPVPWPNEVRADFVALLGTGAAAVPVLDSLDIAGLLVALIPEWDAVRCKAQHNPVHRFTVDRHLLETAANAAALTREVDRPDLLLVGSLLHDIGKGYTGDHSVTGAVHARDVAERMGFAPADVETIVALVRHHLLLPDTALRRDLDDPRTLEIVTGAVSSNAEVVELLHALAIADAAATGPGAWSDWKARLIAELVQRVRAVLQGAPQPEPAPIDEELRELAAAGQLAVIIRDGQVLVAMPDGVGVLYRTAGVLALHSMDVRAASIATLGGMAVNKFDVVSRFGQLPDPALLRADLARALEGQLGLADKLREKERVYGRTGDPPKRRPPRVLWFDGQATDATVIEIRAEDSIGLLCRVTAALERAGLDVRSALVASLGVSVVDSFYVTTRTGGLVPADQRSAVEQELRGV